MKNRRILLIVICFLIVPFAVVQAQTMLVKEKSGSQTQYLINNIGKISFSSGQISILKKNSVQTQYPLATIRYLSFTDLSNGISKNDKQNMKTCLTIFPNPVKDELTIQLSKFENKELTFELMSIDGKVVLTKNILNTVSFIQVSVSELPHGLYICKATSDGYVGITKFIKQ